MSADLDPATGDVAAALYAAVDQAQVIRDDEAVVVVACRDDVNVCSVDLERYQVRPERSRGTVEALTAEGFIEAFRQRSDDPAHAVVYADPDRFGLVGVLDDDWGPDDEPGWRQNRVALSLSSTAEWQHWHSHQGLGSQGRFAEVIEDGEPEIVTPSPTFMAEIAQGFHASISAKFRQMGRLKDGRTQLVWEEDVDAKGTTSEGDVAIPDVFTIAVRPFLGCAPREVLCRLRFRIEGGKLQIGYKLHRPDDVRREAFRTDVLGLVRSELEGTRLVEGRPADPLEPGR